MFRRPPSQRAKGTRSLTGWLAVATHCVFRGDQLQLLPLSYGNQCVVVVFYQPHRIAPNLNLSMMSRTKARARAKEADEEEDDDLIEFAARGFGF